jgi:hypothetical protein
MPFVMDDAPTSGRFVLDDGAPASGGVMSDFGNAALHNVMKPLHGLAQLVENGAAAGANLLPDNPVSRAIVNAAASDNAAQQQWERQYQGSVPNNAASYAGATAGTVLPFLATGAAKGLQTLGDAVASLVSQSAPKLLPKIVSGAVQGGVVAASNPVDNGQPYWAQKRDQVQTGAELGGAIPVGAAVIGGAYNAGRNALLPLTSPNTIVQQGLQRFGVSPDSLGGTAELVPGSMPTTAQLAQNPQIVAAEKALANNPAYKPLFDARQAANNDARWNVINGIAQSPEALQAAIQARKAATSPLQAALLENGNAVPVAPILEQLSALGKSPLAIRPTVASAANDIASKLQELATPDAQGNLTIGPAHLDAVRQNVKDYLAKYSPNGAIGTQQQAAFEPVRNSIVDAIEGANPGYRDYLAKYAQLSAPINTMEAGQSIVDNLGSRALDATGNPALTLTGLNGQVKKALDRPYGISPDAQAALAGVQADLQRATISNSLRVPGSDTSYNMQAPGWLASSIYGNNFQGGKLLPAALGALGGMQAFTHGAGMTGAATSAAGGAYAGRLLSDFASKRVNDALAEALLNPAVAQQLLTDAQSSGSPMLSGLLSRIPQASLLMNDPLANRALMPSLLGVSP